MSTSRTLRWPASAGSGRLPDETVKNSLEWRWRAPGSRVVPACGDWSREGSEEATAGGWSGPVPAAASISARVQESLQVKGLTLRKPGQGSLLEECAFVVLL